MLPDFRVASSPFLTLKRSLLLNFQRLLIGLACLLSCLPPSTRGQEADNPDLLKESGSISAGKVDWDQLDDPSTDGWDIEEFNNLAGNQLKDLGTLLASGETIPPESFTSLAAKTYRGSPLLPTQLNTSFQSDDLLVQRGPAGAHPQTIETIPGLASSLNDLIKPLAGTTEARSKFKIFRVNQLGDTVSTEAYFGLSGRTQSGRLEQHAVWKIDWSWQDLDSDPIILGITASGFEQTTRSGPDWFVDCTESLLKANDCYEPQLLRGYGHWLGRIPHGVYLESMGSPGLTIGDVNSDGLDDFYLCQERGLPNRLFLQQPDGTAKEVSAAWGVDWLESSRSALFLDFDNDGDQDLAVAVMGGVVLASNEDGKRFEFKTLLPTTEDIMSLASVDYDGDGDLDLYVCGYFADKKLDSYGDAGGSALPTAEAGFVMHDANTGGKSHLFRNDLNPDSPEWTFKDVTVEVGLDVNNRRYSFGASWEDFDNDGDQDLYIANDFGRDNLYRNDKGKFLDISDAANIEDCGTGMGITWGDFNRDGLMDAYVSNMFSSAGNRITFQDKFKSDADPAVKKRIQRLARGNTVLQNNGDGSFNDISGTSGAEMGRWSWGSLFVDFNNDGWEDLIAANGYITADDTGDL